ncbi:aminotransferase [Blastomyces dermatitidis ER-3]|uniref:Aminotransferase n=1 Tax=Ajellomyces dermatitidis (strain ER-3 / ATCC MYA-2586) TaxID=559297 RepID=A0ABP2EZK4_AJEDR|nr:aminotransferase [Blastomyces dermatitidis ER-3]EEQ89739.1 aminotransferase [Blastomyces dermatitidis ER-3]
MPINLFRGWPNPSLHPIPALTAATSAVLSSPLLSTPALNYGPDEGDPGLRDEIARWLSNFYSPPSPVAPSRICITGGASQNLACLLQVFSDPLYTKNVWMVAPTYYLACRIFDDAGFAGKLRGVREDEEGLDIGGLERGLEASEERARAELKREGDRNRNSGAEDFELRRAFKPSRPWRKLYKHIIYTTPTFSNPSTRIMSLRRREELVRLARKYDALIISDDVYDHLQWPASPSTCPIPEYPGEATVPRIVDVDRFLDGGPLGEFGNAVSNGSFSKLIGAGCRVGWAEGTEKFVHGLSQAGSSRSGGCPSQFTSTFVRELLASNSLQTHIRTVLQPAYSKRFHSLTAAVRKHLFPLGVSLPNDPASISSTETDPNANTISTCSTGSQSGIAGGYFLWLRLPPGLRASNLAKKAQEEEDLMIAGGNLFKVVREDYGHGNDDCVEKNPEDFEGFVRLCFAWEEDGKFDEGVQRLARLIRREMREIEREPII